jgi:hypothetical protein
MHDICPAGPCTACGSEKNSRIHHVDHNPLNNAPENLVRMCHACHITHHKHYNKIVGQLENRIRQLEAILLEARSYTSYWSEAKFAIELTERIDIVLHESKNKIEETV